MNLRMWSGIAALAGFALVMGGGVYARQAGAPKPATAAKASKAARGRVPAALVGSWTWGTVNPGRYVDKVTGEYVGNAGGGAISYTFGADGSHKRYVLIQLGAGFSNESVFSAMEGTVDFDEAAGTFSINLTKGTVTFEKPSGRTKKPLTKEGMAQGGNTFAYRLEKDEDGRQYLLVSDKGKPVAEGRRFYKDEPAK